MNPTIFALVLATIFASSSVNATSIIDALPADAKEDAQAAIDALSTVVDALYDSVNQSVEDMSNDNYNDYTENAISALETTKNKTNDQLNRLKGICKEEPTCVACFEPQEGIEDTFNTDKNEIQSFVGETLETGRQEIKNLSSSLDKHADEVKSLQTTLSNCGNDDCCKEVKKEAETYKTETVYEDDTADKVIEIIVDIGTVLKNGTDDFKTSFSKKCNDTIDQIVACIFKSPSSSTDDSSSSTDDSSSSTDDSSSSTDEPPATGGQDNITLNVSFVICMMMITKIFA